MERNSQKIGLINFLVLLLAGAILFVLARVSHTFSGQVGSVFFGIGFLCALVSYLQMRLEEREQLEKLEFDELAREKNAASLFSAGAEALPARHSREQFERYFLPIFTVVLFILQAAAVYFLWKWLRKATVVAPAQPMVVLSLVGVNALILFLLGKYAANLARLGENRLLRPGGSFLVFGAYVSAAIVIAVGLLWGGVQQADLYLARALCVILALIAVETLVSLIFEMYRPRVRGQAARLVYESRLVGLLGQPEGIFTTAAQALDYQFGFKVSETWFYRFLERALAWIILVQLLVLLFSTSFVFIGPGEQAVIERFGKPLAGGKILNPGPHIKMPWPIDKVYRVRTDEIQRFNVGFVADEQHAGKETVLWTVSHYKEEFNLLVASRDQQAGTNNPAADQSVPVDLLTVSIPVQFQIKDIKAWVYNYTDAASLLEKIATREVIRFLVGADIFDIMSSGRAHASEQLKKLIQERSDELKLGVNIIFVGLQDIHPPIKVAPSYESVIAVRQENEAKLRTAEGYAARNLSLSRAVAQRLIHEAQSYKNRKISGAQAQAAQYANQVMAYKASPEVFMQRAYLNAFSVGSTNSRKYVITSTNTDEVITLNLEDKVRRELLDTIAVPPPKN
ncbi:MAG: protease modulator HflK [Verrucomicrobiota bacterium]|nr:protease modulator HflK [Verrucomicrobiota bacterium]